MQLIKITTLATERILHAALLVAVMISFSAIGSAQEEDEEFDQREAEAQDDVRRAIEAFNAGQTAHAAGDLDKAAELYAEALRLVPEFPEAEFQLGSIYETRGRAAEAEASYRRAILYKPDWTLPMSALGSLLISAERFEDAKAVLERTLEIDGLCIPCYPALTEAYLRTGVSDEILRTHLQKLTILTSKSKIPASVWASKAAVERARGDRAAARESVRRGLELDPENASVLTELVEIRIAEGDFEGAATTARRVSDRYPDSTSAKLRLARAEHLAGRTDAAIRLLEGLTAQDRQTAELLSALKLQSADDPQTLLKQLEGAPDDAAILGRLCSATRLSDPENSLQYCFKASQAEPSNIVHALGYGAALLQLKRYEQAAAILERLKTGAPDNYTVRANLATAFFQMGRFDDARAEYEWIIAREPGVAAAHYFLAISLDRLRRYPEALLSYQNFLKIADENSFADEIGRVELRLPVLARQIKEGKGKN